MLLNLQWTEGRLLFAYIRLHVSLYSGVENSSKVCWFGHWPQWIRWIWHLVCCLFLLKSTHGRTGPFVGLTTMFYGCLSTTVCCIHCAALCQFYLFLQDNIITLKKASHTSYTFFNMKNYFLLCINKKWALLEDSSVQLWSQPQHALRSANITLQDRKVHDLEFLYMC